jgi:hypothetical protein
MGLGGDAATSADEFIEIVFRNSDGASKPMGHNRPAMNQSAHSIVMKPQFGGDFWNS